MKHYATYKPTGIAWLPQIPEQWHTQRIKTLFRLRDERSYKPLSDVNLISVYAKMGVLQHKDIEHTTGNRAHNADGYKIVYPNDIIVNILLCWMGAIGHSEYQGVTSPAYDVYTPIISLNSKYYSYLFRTPLFSQQCYRVGKGIMAMRWRTYSPQFSNIPVPRPPHDEQDQIVRFLDWKVSGINKLIQMRKNQIKKLEELKIIIIAKTILHGFSETAPIKYSGLSFIGNIRSNRQISLVKKEYSVVLGKMLDLTSKQGTLENYLCATNIKWTGVKTNIQKQMFFSEQEKQQYKLQDGDLLVMEGGMAGTACIYHNEFYPCYIQNSVLRCRPLKNMLKVKNKFLYYWIFFLFHSGYIDSICSKATIKHYTKEKLSNTPLILVDELEQQSIVTYLDGKCDTINQDIVLKKKNIELLQELKTRLISDVVTGKIDVRGIEIPEYEFIAEESPDDADASDDEMGSEVEEN